MAFFSRSLCCVVRTILSWLRKTHFEAFPFSALKQPLDLSVLERFGRTSLRNHLGPGLSKVSLSQTSLFCLYYMSSLYFSFVLLFKPQEHKVRFIRLFSSWHLIITGFTRPLLFILSKYLFLFIPTFPPLPFPLIGDHSNMFYVFLFFFNYNTVYQSIRFYTFTPFNHFIYIIISYTQNCRSFILRHTFFFYHFF